MLAFLYQIPAVIHNQEVLSMTRYFKGSSKASIYMHRNGPKDKYFNCNLQKLAMGATIISPKGNLKRAAQWAATWMLATKNWARGSYTDFWSQSWAEKHSKMQTNFYIGQVSSDARGPDANGILQLNWECASHSLDDISVVCKKCSRLGRGHSVVEELKLVPAYP